MRTVAFTKTYLTPSQHIALLKSRGLHIPDELKALFTAFHNIDSAAMGFPADWETEPLWR